MKTTLLFLAGLSIAIANAQTFEYLDINQVKARINSGGDMHWGPSNGGFGGYECPKGSGKIWGGPASLWMGGIDATQQLHLAAQTHHQGSGDYWPGPISISNATTNSVVVNQYNRVWKLNKSDIDNFISNFANGNVQNGSFIPSADLLSWPGNGDISQDQAIVLAPFHDVNNDGLYNPLTDGDYPLIKGDQAIYTIFNDNYLSHQSSGAPAIGIEVHLMAYAYGTCNIINNNSFLNYTTFYNYKIINRSSLALYDTYISLFNDSDIGIPAPHPNEFTGCDVQDNYGYIYNINSLNSPAVGVVQLKGPINTTNGIDDDNDGLIDEPFENMRMTNFMYYNNSLPAIPSTQSDPSNSTQYYQYMRSFWKDGTPLTCGGNGYGGSIPTSHAYPSNTFTNSSCGMTGWMESGAGSDKRFVLSSGPYEFQPGMTTELEYAYITSFDSITNNPLGKLDTDVENLHSIYYSSLNQCLNTNIKEQNILNEFSSISPNPTNEFLTIASQLKANYYTVQIIDALGKVLISEEHKELNQTSINVSDLNSGIYFVKIISGEYNSTKKFIKE